ncbi:hypothetical protein COV56_02615 [Candidatus Kuenenbacteria bacterium CG11_big_fil_rev_8_21_14_0_20_37_9]|uniref:Glycosyltransferase 2-like domain-containing protein n=2 Tax=Candidatus Kueneniibacteriota TaxID=1752740 RepID=A0A2M6XTA1_9BACT|nr:MAG: hypothetical protein AUJ29_00980 [Candidatus Kuenenbacteria bacterium CG1_02_38_13]PIR05489.1 MAG: hypothetical protein COV56_02615 [Candidatus Kuenenbacteria bacterium CG11_big_fil_rev_8_21_14_0_20_37_9]PIU10870.1 MAG: hypothetical protein COT27_00885 [Candidatus Kuenenbacteria bacterium CG08_land_8_20_14_0_20_37_23]
MNKISIVIVTFNAMKYLPDFLESIFEQSYYIELREMPNIFIIDNASSDKTIDFIRKNYHGVNILRNVNNIGLARALNQGIRMTHGEYVLIMNPDLVLHKDFLKQAMETITNDEAVGSVGGKLYQLKIEGEEGLLILEKTNILDSCGIQVFKSRRFIERGAGEIDNGQYDKKEDVFGISGALVLYRRKAIEQIKFGEEYFDEDFFMYKEDVDMAWRLRLAKWKNIYNPLAIGYHHRSARSQNKTASNLAVASWRNKKNNFINYHSYKNHWMLLCKNEFSENVLHHLPYIAWYELKKFIYMLLFETGNLARAVRAIVMLYGKQRQKMKMNMRITKIKAYEIREWFE